MGNQTGEFTSRSQKELDNPAEIKNLKKLEAVLFISGRWLSIKQLVELTDINPLFLKELLEKMRDSYLHRDSAIEIIEKNEMWKMDVKPEHHRIINKFATGSAEFSKAEQETLAVIAYKQPVKQSVIVKIRGNKAYEHIRHLVDVGLLKSKKLGRTKELSLSSEFYDYFHLKPKEKKIERIEKVVEGGEEVGKEGAEEAGEEKAEEEDEEFGEKESETAKKEKAEEINTEKTSAED